MVRMLKVLLKRKLVILMVVSLERTLKIRVEHHLQFFNYRDPRNITVCLICKLHDTRPVTSHCIRSFDIYSCKKQKAWKSRYNILCAKDL